MHHTEVTILRSKLKICVDPLCRSDVRPANNVAPYG